MLYWLETDLYYIILAGDWAVLYYTETDLYFTILAGYYTILTGD